MAGNLSRYFSRTLGPVRHFMTPSLHDASFALYVIPGGMIADDRCEVLRSDVPPANVRMSKGKGSVGYTERGEGDESSPCEFFPCSHSLGSSLYEPYRRELPYRRATCTMHVHLRFLQLSATFSEGLRVDLCTISACNGSRGNRTRYCAIQPACLL